MDELLFADREEALKTINQWILDGSKIESWSDYLGCSTITLRGSDGCKEQFYIFDTEEDKQAFLNPREGD